MKNSYIATIDYFKKVKHAAEALGYTAQMIMPFNLLKACFNLDTNDRDNLIENINRVYDIKVIDIFKLKNKFAFVVVYKK